MAGQTGSCSVCFFIRKRTPVLIIARFRFPGKRVPGCETYYLPPQLLHGILPVPSHVEQVIFLLLFEGLHVTRLCECTSTSFPLPLHPEQSFFQVIPEVTETPYSLKNCFPLVPACRTSSAASCR